MLGIQLVLTVSIKAKRVKVIELRLRWFKRFCLPDVEGLEQFKIYQQALRSKSSRFLIRQHSKGSARDRKFTNK